MQGPSPAGLVLLVLIAIASITRGAAAQPERQDAATSVAAGARHYVAPGGDDHNSGRVREAAWRTIQHAADVMLPADTVIVLPGNYPERVRMVRSGGPGRPIAFEAAPGARAAMQGFEIAASYVRVEGFDISNRNQTEPAGFGIQVIGSHDVIAHNYLHDLCMEGIVISGGKDRDSAGTAHNLVLDNRVVHAQMAGIHVEGRQNVVERNEVSHTAQYPAGCRSRFRADADAFRFFGSGHVFRANYAYDIAWGTRENPDPHVDCFQTWGPATDIVIERNLCVWPAATTATNNKAIEIESLGHPSAGITVRNNIFVSMRQGINASGAQALRVLNNTFAKIVQEGVILSSVPNSEIANNIFYEVGSGRDSYACIDPASQQGLVIVANDHYMKSGQPGSYCSQASHLTLDPNFVDPDRLDFRLGPGSPLAGVGVVLTDVSNDFFGKSRREGQKRYDLGAIAAPVQSR